ncbi:unnamed protein product [Calypogeia fissa]
MQKSKASLKRLIVLTKKDWQYGMAAIVGSVGAGWIGPLCAFFLGSVLADYYTADKQLMKRNITKFSWESSTGKDSNANLHKGLFVPGGLPDDTEVAYYVKGQRYLTGVKKGLGILCGCCDRPSCMHLISSSVYMTHSVGLMLNLS